MTLRDLKDAVCGLALHDLTPVNAESVAVEGGSVVFGFEESALAIELAEVKADLESAREDYAESDKRADELEAELDKARTLLAEVKNDKGGTLAKYADRAEQAELVRDGWLKAYHKADAELTALRKRKGMLASLYANQAAVMDLLRDAQAGRRIDAAKAKELCQKITHESRT